MLVQEFPEIMSSSNEWYFFIVDSRQTYDICETARHLPKIGLIFFLKLSFFNLADKNVKGQATPPLTIFICHATPLFTIISCHATTTPQNRFHFCTLFTSKIVTSINSAPGLALVVFSRLYPRHLTHTEVNLQKTAENGSRKRPKVYQKFRQYEFP